jgi:hypothetical protein
MGLSALGSGFLSVCINNHEIQKHTCEYRNGITMAGHIVPWDPCAGAPSGSRRKEVERVINA